VARVPNFWFLFLLPCKISAFCFFCLARGTDYGTTLKATLLDSAPPGVVTMIMPVVALLGTVA
jgi:hypothetical protein